jgi:Tfp pilus assembly protein PilF/mono/diheme cytochrome c family protein
MNRASRFFAFVLASRLISGLALARNDRLSAQSATPSVPQITFTRDIAPIVFENCSVCHRPGEAAPFPLLTYQDAKSHARQIAALTARRVMPPWLPEPGPHKFGDELRLTDAQIALIQQWVDQGAHEGNSADLPAAPHFVVGWQLGQPDKIVTAEKPFNLPAAGSDLYWNFIFRAPVDKTRWLKAIEIRPGDKRVVHHANILVDRGQSARLQEARPGEGFAGMELKIVSETFDPDSHFLFWKPGTITQPEPDGLALRLDPGTDLVLNIHLQPSGKPESVQPSLGLYFTDKPATLFPLLLQLESDTQLDIPPGEKNFVVTDEFTLPLDVDLLGIYPHAHYLGKDLLATAKLPNGTTETLIHIPRWDLNWQAVYRYATPVSLPKGTTISMRYAYDNSEDNPLNPNDPPKRVLAGNRSSDEMAHLWLQVLPYKTPADSSDPRMILQEALALHKVQKNPADFEAHYNLGAMLLARGQIQDSIAQYQQANRLHPNDPTVNNALGAALLASGQPEPALPCLVAALHAQPDNFDAHYNLASAFLALGKLSEALDQFRAALRLHPDDARAEANVGSILAEAANWSEAKAHLERALQLDPTLAFARDNLDIVNRQLQDQPKN